MRDLFTKDLGWKIFSLVLAIVLYFTVRTLRESLGDSSGLLETRATHSYLGVPVKKLILAGDVREFSVNPKSVRVDLRGLPETLLRLSPEDIRVTVDLTGITSSESLKRPVFVSTPPGITLVGVTPSEVDITVPTEKAN